ncbi:DUF3329 domain-containing protein [Turicibacter sanguinis]|uniref:DUF3329 domain-containing protein n=1 Tax=Turicibacter sanguinis TaxID=154288 RepID=UPI00189ACDA1|nr:DUF6056 family protein [Turicibacter sanguinis]
MNLVINLITNIRLKFNDLGYKICFILILLIWGILIYNINCKTFFTADDYTYHFVYESFMPTDETKRVENIGDIFYSMYNHYFLWGGRIPAHFIAQLFLLWGKPIFNILNTLAYLILAIVVCIHINPSKRINLFNLTMVLLLFWFFIPQFGLSVFWLSGACNYLWNTLIILMFLVPYRVFLHQYKINNSKLFAFIMLISGVVAGWTNENTGGAMICLILLFNYVLYYQKIKVPIWNKMGLFGAIIGFLTLILAPGNRVRSSGLNFDFILYIKQIILFFADVISNYGLLLILVGGILIINLHYLKEKKYIISLMYFLACILGILALVLSPIRPLRTLFGPLIFSFIALMINVNLIFPILKKYKYLLVYTLIVGYTIVGSQYLQAFLEVKSTYNFIINEQIEVIRQCVNDNNCNEVKVSMTPNTKNKYNANKGTANLETDSKGWFNSWMAKYYELDSIAIKE